MTDPAPNTSRNVSTTSAQLASDPRFNGTGIISAGGTGCLIADEWVLTARHVVAGATNGIFYLEGTNRAFTEVYTRSDSDVALVRLSSPVTNYPITPIYGGTNESNQPVYLVGYGQHGQFTGNPAELSSSFQGRYAAMNRVGYSTNLGGTTGICLQFSYDGTNAGALPYEGATAPGDSGGPMFMEENGRLWVVGETFGVAPPAPGFYHGRVSAYLDWIETITGINFNQVDWDANASLAGIQEGSGTWNGSNSNWTFGRINFPWANGYDVVFGAGSGTNGTITLATSVTTGNLTFKSGAITNHFLTGSSTLTLKAGAVVTAEKATTLQLPLSGSSLTLVGPGTNTLRNTGYNGNLVVSGPMVVEETNDRTWSGTISGGSNWFKQGPGTLTLSASNTFSGFLTVAEGAVRAGHSSALGTSVGSVVNGGNAQAALELSGNIAVPDQVQLVMHNNAGHTQLRNVSGSNTMSGNILLNSGGGRWDVASLAGVLTLSGSISNIANSTNSWRTLHLHGPGEGRLTGQMADSTNGIDKLNLTILSGDWTLAGSNKAYTGKTTVSNGILRIQTSLASEVEIRPGAALAHAGTGSTSSNLILNGGSTLRRSLTNWTSPGPALTAAKIIGTNTNTNTALVLLLDATDLSGFTESNKTVPLLAGTFSNFSTSSISVVTTNFSGKGTWTVQTSPTNVNLQYTVTPYDLWKSSIGWGVANNTDGADPDGDGLANFMEYALGLNPLARNSGPSLGIVSNRLSLTFTRTNDPALLYEVIASATLTNWPETVWSSTNTAPTNGAVTVIDTSSIGTQSKRFLRLKISR